MLAQLACLPHITWNELIAIKLPIVICAVSAEKPNTVLERQNRITSFINVVENVNLVSVGVKREDAFRSHDTIAVLSSVKS